MFLNSPWRLCAALLLLAAPLSAQKLRPPTQLDSSNFGAFDPAVASSGESTAAAWVEAVTNNVMVATTYGSAHSWGDPQRVDGDTVAGRKDVERDGVAVNGDAVYVLWKDERHNVNNDELYFNYSLDHGATWNGEVLVPKNYPLLAGSIRDWALATSGGNVYVVFTVDPTTNADEELYLASFDFGLNAFNPPVKVPAGATPTDDVDFFGVAATGLTVHVAWMDDRNGNASFDDVWYQRSLDGGATWNATDTMLDVTSGFGLGDAEDGVTVAAFGSVVMVAWMEELASATNEELRAAVSPNNGVNWNPDVMVGGYNPATADVDNPTAAAINSVLYLTWEDNRNVASTDEVFVATSTNQGAAWTETALSGGQNGGFPRLAAAGAHAGVAWSGGTSGAENALGAFSENSGGSWTGALNLSMNAAGDVDNTELAFNDAYDNFVSVFLSDELLGGGVNNVFGGGASYPVTLSVANLTGGSTATFTVDNATPGGTVGIAYSLTGDGVTTVPAGPCGNVTAHLQPPFTVLALVNANPSGTATFSTNVPPVANGAVVWFHALDLGSCNFSNHFAQVVGNVPVPPVFYQADLDYGPGATQPNSNTGSMELLFLPSPDVLYVNLSVNGQWQLENVPVLTTVEEGAQFLSFDFSLGVPQGQNVSNLQYGLMVSPAPQPGPPPSTTPTTVRNLPVVILSGDQGGTGTVNNATGQQGGQAATPAANKCVENQECGTVECVPAAISNSLRMLNKKHKLGIAEADMTIDKMKTATGWDATTGGAPVGANPWWDRKKAYMTANGYPIETDTNVAIDDAAEALKKGHDVEIRVPGHAAVVTSITKLANGKYEIQVKHDTEQDKAGGLKEETITYDPATGKITGGKWLDGKNLDRFIVEKPKAK